MIVVLAIRVTNAALAHALLPRTECVAAGSGRAYFFYETTSADGAWNLSYTDIDGEPLIAAHAFETLAEADAWVQADMRRAA